MVKNHLKRIAVAKTWGILRKNHTFVTRPNPGAHSYDLGMSLNTLFKEVLGLCDTRKEVKKILHDKNVLVDGKRRHDEKFLAGFMDVISFPELKKSYRVGITSKGKVTAFAIKESEATKKLSKIANKHLLKGGKMQLTFSDGRSLVVEKDIYKTNDSLLLSVKDQKVEGHFPCQKGNYVLIVKGKYAGHHGVISSVDSEEIVFTSNDQTIQTKTPYAFVIGDKKPVIECLQ